MFYYGISAVLILGILVVVVLYKYFKDVNNYEHDVDFIYNNNEIHRGEIEECPYNKKSESIRAKRKIVKSLDKSYRNILEGYDYINNEAKSKKDIVSAGEWLLDNLYLIQKEYKQLKNNMCINYCDSLPIICKGVMEGYPRIYYIAKKIVHITDGKIDEEIIENLIKEYQSHTLLTSSELWALPVMLKIAIIQNISKVTNNIVFSQKEKNKGEELGEKLIKYTNDEENLVSIFNQQFSFTPYFTERLLKVLRDSGLDNANVYKWIDDQLAKKETDTKRTIILEHKKQAFFRMIIGNSITGMREISSLNWKQCFEKLSYLEQTLREDPAKLYDKMDFSSRDYYRRNIEKLARYMKLGETFVAKKAIECALENEYIEDKAYLRHVGYYIIDDGIECLKNKIGFKDKGIERLKNSNKNKKVNYYINFIVITTILLSFILLYLNLYPYYDIAIWKYIIGFLIILIPVSEIVTSIANWSINHLLKPSFIPKVEFKDSIPEEYSTIVVIPTLLNNKKRVKELIEDLEIYYLANKSENIYYAILGDFKDSQEEHEEKDEEIIQSGLNGVKQLNQKYASKEKDIFYFFNRYRQFNEKEGTWLGWERKRGKLMEFNALIRGDKNTSYNVISGNLNELYKAKYIITLDADTQLPMDSAKKLIGAMAHLLNKPYIDKEKKAVLRGHGLMQPRINVSTVSANKTLFSKIFSGETGIDLYTTAISDVYQDLFDEGIFTGKGIYDVDTFNYMLRNEMPENSVLSHDLLEGSYVRAALLTDVELIDGYPAYYNSSSKRLHRWVRGDWQLVPWLAKKTSLNKLSKWKIFDNLRRSLLAPSIIILILLSLVLFSLPDKWLIVALIGLLAPMLFDVSESVIMPIKGISLSGKIYNWKIGIEQFFLIFSFLPYQAYLMLDAIIRTLYRVYISKKNLLEWQTAADAEASSGRELKHFVHSMWQGSAIAVVIAVLAFYKSINMGFILLPSCIIWFLSPYIAYFISKERKEKIKELSEEEIILFRRLSRKIWSYFEDFNNNKNNWLAPDNYQEYPENGLAHRTSPTNMGMGITSNIVAFDLGYIDLCQCIYRLNEILNSMDSLDKYEGHFYNWYDTNTKEPLYPKYISTVDSGNLLGYLWLLNISIEEFLDTPILNINMTEGLIDLLRICEDELENEEKIDYRENMEALINWNEDTIELMKILKSLKEIATNLIKKYEKDDKLYWNKKLLYTVNTYINNIYKLFPWVQLLEDYYICESRNNNNFFHEDERNILDKLIDIIKFEGVKEAIVKLQHIEDKIERLDIYSYKNLNKIYVAIINGKKEINNLYKEINKLKLIIDKIASEMNFSILFNESKQLFSIGYDVEKGKIDNCYYDLLASEARQASFISIAKGDVNQTHWFKLGRALTSVNKNKGLVSWSGTMFEYLMPLLIMKSYPDTLLDNTYNFVVDSQKFYGNLREVPWGISESSFYAFDVNLNYQYKAFGVPGVGLKRGLSNELVISPYSSIMALQVNRKDSFLNIKKMIEKGFEGRYGLYEAIDYTKERLPKGKEFAIIKSYMVHHEGMSLMALDNILRKNILQSRFHRDPKVRAAELLLQEKMPNMVVYDREEKYNEKIFIKDRNITIVRKYLTARTTYPETHLLSNGDYSIMITNSGSGYSKKDNMMVYRWKEDITEDNTGMFFYVKNLNSNEYWSNFYQPCKNEGDSYEVNFSLDKAEFNRVDGNIKTTTQIAVLNEDNGEVRKLFITNNSNSSRTVEITSYCEVTLTNYSADLVHPTFSNLFIKTEYIEDPLCLLAYRRKRQKEGKEPWAIQTVLTDDKIIGKVQYETSRPNFIGRNRNLSKPEVMENDSPLSNTVGAVLDPILSIRVRVQIPPGETCHIAYTTAVADSREEAIKLGRKYRQWSNINRIFELAWTQSQVETRYLGINSSIANVYQSLASKIIFLNNTFRERENYIKSINKGQSDLWPYGISGDLPIVVLLIRKEQDLDLVRQMLKAHEYLNLKGLKIDLVILNLEDTSYIQALQESILDIINSSHARDIQNRLGGVFLYNKSTMAEEYIKFIMSICRLIIDGEKGGITAHIRKNENLNYDIKLLKHNEISFNDKGQEIEIPKLNYFNSLGGFTDTGDKYVIVLEDYKNTPAPWINVISNGNFGFHVSESGIAYTWYKNSRENKITTWSNDPVKDSESEALYIRDEVFGKLWSISPKPIRDEGRYIIEHGFGYSTFKHKVFGIGGEVTMFSPMNNSIKLSIVKLKNDTDVERKLSVTYYAQLVLGVVPQQTAQYISTYINSNKEYMYAKNPYSNNFGNLIAYLKIAGGEDESYTGSRSEFIGKEGFIENPEALKKERFSNTVGSGLDPCMAVNSKITLKPNEEKYVLILLGEDENIYKVDECIEKYRSINVVLEELENVKNYWKDMLGRIQIETPDKTMDIMVNGWLMYQAIACRYWARTAFYQSGGAYGFRDQLQDSLAISYIEPDYTRKQILYSASRQFIEGDVQHWWHPVVDSGIRTRFSDDLLWLPYVTAQYIENTGDYGILDEIVPYLEDEPLKEGEDERYNIARQSNKDGSIYEHCINAIDRALKFGEHNIPLMGSGDWNDGMSTVGNKGKGESVWLGWFLYTILKDFINICNWKDDKVKEEKYKEMSSFIIDNIEANAWDGNWYRRAYFDDGTPLGSSENDEAQIDSLSQSWAVISGGARESRAKEAMLSVERYLVKYDKGLVMLLTPAFDKSSLEPGYIKGYVPGVRENGGQYTHAAIWYILALTMIGFNDKAHNIFNMINPINHTLAYLDCERFKVEPYVVTADVYAVEPHIGRGGWSWYTGAAGWMYTTAVTGILGLKLDENRGFRLKPNIPKGWNEFKMTYKRGKCVYKIDVKRDNEEYINLDGKRLDNDLIPFLTEGEHFVEVAINH
ncbi:GH36-type glycosyl hydrolase domain-containing protein [Clostridium tetanomorphum]|uniref:Cyclic beta 1-2 glucan synthetase n=1 Tax=Clostridium tetanomorphum TaxID=1553 RepID=A0A923J2S6_CLOTT|nr:glucoamylase family protein [Clostridium tetanomorphum]MBC2399085.1 cyclic beta 1-2 glucan synthetase [Clostridium tetanomorphum]NRZ95902.1 cellobiose phosphorylase [Clostridium tetanomorphum]